MFIFIFYQSDGRTEAQVLNLLNFIYVDLKRSLKVFSALFNNIIFLT